MQTVYVGIDPGLDGAVGVIWPGNARVYDTPTIVISKQKVNKKTGKERPVSARDYNGPAMAQILRDVKIMAPRMEVACCIERVHAMPKQGVTSAFTFGAGYGMWLGILAALGIAHDRVHPARWKKEIMGDMGKAKDAAILRASQLFPYVAARGEFSRKKDDGRAEALLLAYFRKKQDQR